MENQLLDKYKWAVRKNRLGLISSGLILFYGDRINESMAPSIGYRIDWIFFIISFCVLMYFATMHLKCPNCHDIIDARMATKIEHCPNCGVKINEKYYFY